MHCCKLNDMLTLRKKIKKGRTVFGIKLRSSSLTQSWNQIRVFQSGLGLEPTKKVRSRSWTQNRNHYVETGPSPSPVWFQPTTILLGTLLLTINLSFIQVFWKKWGCLYFHKSMGMIRMSCGINNVGCGERKEEEVRYGGPQEVLLNEKGWGRKKGRRNTEMGVKHIF